MWLGIPTDGEKPLHGDGEGQNKILTSKIHICHRNLKLEQTGKPN
jgi:hypothetical protein